VQKLIGFSHVNQPLEHHLCKTFKPFAFKALESTYNPRGQRPRPERGVHRVSNGGSSADLAWWAVSDLHSVDFCCDPYRSGRRALKVRSAGSFRLWG